jgi:hypothetical protein
VLGGAIGAIIASIAIYTLVAFTGLAQFHAL